MQSHTQARTFNKAASSAEALAVMASGASLLLLAAPFAAAVLELGPASLPDGAAAGADDPGAEPPPSAPWLLGPAEGCSS